MGYLGKKPAEIDVDIDDASITAAELAANSVDSSELVDGSIDTSHISADAVTGAKIADDAINSEHYTDGSIDTAHIGDDQVTAAKIVDNIALPGNITTTGTLAPTGVLTANAGVVVDNITIDGTEIDLSSGDLTIDVAGDINLDADGGDITFKDGGTSVGKLDLTGGFAIKSEASDADFFIKGNDGGSTITALTLDMSEAGAATFNDKIVATELDISGNIDVDGTANLDVVDIDGAVDMASTLGVSGVVTANAGVVVDNITIDGTEIDLSSGDMTMDIAGNLRIDCGDNGEVRFYDGGTQYGVIKEDSERLKLQSIIQDKDILFAGNDGGSEITALTLDMSEAGAATFNAGITAAGATLSGNLTMMSNVVYASQVYVADRLGHLNDQSTFIDFADDTIKFATASEAMRIDSSNNVGIGCTNAGSRLEVRGAANGTALLEVTGTDGRGLKIFTQKSDYPTDSGQNDAVVVYNAQDTENAAYPGHVFQYGGNEVLRLQQIESSGATGAVGINDNAPAYTLDVNTDGESNAMRITQGTNTKDCSVVFQNTATGTGDDTYLTMMTAHAAGDPFVRLQISGYEHWDLRVDNSDNDSFKIMQQSDTRMMITGGRILFGTSSELSPTSRVFINSNSNSTNPALNLKAATTTSSGSILIFFAGDSDEVGAVSMSNLEQGTGVSYGTSSDYRLKENVSYTYDATTRLKQLKPCRFSWKKDSNSTMQDGFLAHEVSSIVPEAVTGDKDAMQPIRYKEGDNIPSGKQVGDETGSYSTTEIKSQMLDPAKLVPLLVKTIQELEARITVLEG